MNGPQHYIEGERLLALAEQTDWTTEHEPYRGPAIAAAHAHFAAAQVCATMELAGATAPGWAEALESSQ